MYTKAYNDMSWRRFQKYVSWTRITIQSLSEKKTRVKDHENETQQSQNAGQQTSKLDSTQTRVRVFFTDAGNKAGGERGVSTYREIPYGWNLTIVDSHWIYRTEGLFSAQSICLPLPSPTYEGSRIRRQRTTAVAVGAWRC